MDVDHGEDQKSEKCPVLEASGPAPPSSGWDPMALLVDGFVRQHAALSTALLDLIRGFVQRMKGASFSWQIRGKLLSSILHQGASSKHKGFESDIFEVCPFVAEGDAPDFSSMALAVDLAFSASASSSNPWAQIRHNVRSLRFKFYLKIYPNGSRPERAGQFEVALVLISLPSLLSRLRFHYQMHCHPLDAYWSSLVHFKSAGAPHTHFVTDTDAATTTDALSRRRVRALSFFCTLDVIRVGIKMPLSLSPSSSSKRSSRSNKEHPVFFSYAPRYFFDVNDRANHRCKFLMKESRHRFQWDLRKPMIATLCASEPGKTVISDVFHNQWALSLRHSAVDAASSAANDDDAKLMGAAAAADGILTIGLQLVALPSNISSLVVQIKVQCLQTASSWTTIKKFDYNHFEYRALFDTEFAAKRLDSLFPLRLSIAAEVVVIEAFDEFGHEMSMIQRQKMDILNGQCPGGHSPGDALLGTHGHIFVPIVRHHPSKSKSLQKRHFQHLCVAPPGSRFDRKSPEELRFEDQYGMRAAPRPSLEAESLEAAQRERAPPNKGKTPQSSKWKRPSPKKTTSELSASPFEEWGVAKPLNANPMARKKRAPDHIPKALGLRQGHRANVGGIELKLEALQKEIANVTRIMESRLSSTEEAKEEESGSEPQQRAVAENAVGRIRWLSEPKPQQTTQLATQQTAEQTIGDKKAASFRKWVVDTLRMEQYHALFVSNGLDDFEVLSWVNDEQLRDIGIQTMGHRIRILQQIQRVRCPECGRKFGRHHEQ